MEAEVAALLIDRCCTARLQIRIYGLFVEIVNSNSEVVYFARRIPGPQDQKVLSEHQLVVAVAFVYFAAEGVLVEIGRSLQAADVKRDMIDAIALEARGRRGFGASGHQSKSLNQIAT